MGRTTRNVHLPTPFKLSSVGSLRNFAAMLGKSSPKHNRNRSITKTPSMEKMGQKNSHDSNDAPHSGRSLETLVTNRDPKDKTPRQMSNPQQQLPTATASATTVDNTPMSTEDKPKLSQD